MDQAVCGSRHFLDGEVERRFIRARWVGCAAQLADELQRRRANFIIGGWGRKIGERFDVPAHDSLLGVCLPY
jgi:hypothetical protein